MIGHLTNSPRYARITFIGPDGKRKKFVGMCHVDGEWVKGAANYDDFNKKGGVVLHLLYARIRDVVKVEQMNPHYETWEVAR